MKLSKEQREEINNLIEESQDDLEGVIFKLVSEREELRVKLELLLNKCKN